MISNPCGVGGMVQIASLVANHCYADSRIGWVVHGVMYIVVVLFGWWEAKYSIW